MDSKAVPAFTTIYYDEAGVQRGLTFFCLQDLPKISGPQKGKDDFFHVSDQSFVAEECRS